MSQNLLSNDTTVAYELEPLLRTGLGEKIPFRDVAVEEHASIEDFNNNYIQKQKPAILRGAAANWPAISQWDFSSLGEKYGDLEVVANLYNVRAMRMINLRQLAEILAQDHYDAPTYLQEWWFQEQCPELMDDIAIPEHFTDDRNKNLFGFYNSTLWLGQKGAYTPLHQDTTYANIWSAQIKGTKQWVLIDKNAEIAPTADGRPDFDRFAETSAEFVYRAFLNPGDILYVPHKWWHRAETLDHAISMNTFYITPDIVQHYVREIFRGALATVLNGKLLQQHDPMRYNILMRRAEILTKMLKFDPSNILGINVDEQAGREFYGSAA